jgi:hypothetical protein
MVGDLNLKNKLLVIYDKILKYFKQYKKNRILKIKCIICVFVSILFIVATYCSSFMLTDKLSETEYTEISELYNEMQRITEIRNKEYVITDLKKIDREKVYHNLRQDSIQYAMIVSRNAFNFYKEGRKADEVRDYIIRCDLTFENIEGLKAPEDVFYYSKMFFQEDTTDLNRLATYSSDISKIVESEQKILDKIGYLNGVKTFFVIMLYLLVLFGIFKSKVIGKVINNI